MATAVGVILVVVMLVASVALHEFGHLLTAKHYGMKATQYFVGFGPKIFSFRRGETEYGLKAIPAGGYVKITGMSPLEPVDGEPDDPRVAARRVARMPTQTVPDGRRLFYTFPALQRFVVLVAGSVTHFVLAIVLTVAALWAGGDLVHNGTPTLTVHTVEQCLTPDPTTGACPAGSPGTPASRAGLTAGDTITAVDGTPVKDWDALVARIEHAAGVPLQLTVRRAGRLRTLTLTPARATRPDPTTGRPETVGVIGVEPGVVDRSFGPLQAITHTPGVLASYVTGSVKVLGQLPSDIPTLVEGKPRSANGIASVVDVARVGGDVAASHESIGDKAGLLLLEGANINFFVGVFNLLPLLPLDGGHAAILLFENGRERLCRLFGRRDPGRVDLMKVMPVAYVVVAAFIGLSLLLVYAGFTNPIQGT